MGRRALVIASGGLYIVFLAVMALQYPFTAVRWIAVVSAVVIAALTCLAAWRIPKSDAGAIPLRQLPLGMVGAAIVLYGAVWISAQIFPPRGVEMVTGVLLGWFSIWNGTLQCYLAFPGCRDARIVKLLIGPWLGVLAPRSR